MVTPGFATKLSSPGGPLADSDLISGTFPERRASVLSSLILLFAQGMEPEAVAEQSVSLVGEATNASAVFVYLWDADAEHLVLRVATPGRQHKNIDDVHLQLGEGIAGWAALRKQAVVLPHAPSKDPRFMAFESVAEDEFHSMVAIPITDEEGVLYGVFALYSVKENAFSHLEFTIASEVGKLLAVGLRQASIVSTLNLHSASSQFLLNMPASCTMSLVKAFQYSAGTLLDICRANFCAIQYVSRQGFQNPPGTFAKKQSDQSDLTVWSTHSSSGIQSAIESGTRGVERLTVPLGFGASQGVLTLARRSPFRPRDKEHVDAVAAQLSVLFEAIDSAAGHSSYVSTFFFEQDKQRLLRTLDEFNLKYPIAPIAFNILSTPGQLQSARSRAVEIFLDMIGPDTVTVSDAHLGVALASASRGIDHGKLSMQIQQAIEQLQFELGTEIGVGIGPVCSAPENFRAAMDAAQEALHWSITINGSNTRVTSYSEIEEVATLPKLWQDISADIIETAKKLRPLTLYDNEHGTELVKTLAVFAQCGGAANSAARSLMIHRNTLRQRLQRIEDHLYEDLSTTNDWVSLYLAARLSISKVEEKT